MFFVFVNRHHFRSRRIYYYFPTCKFPFTSGAGWFLWVEENKAGLTLWTHVRSLSLINVASIYALGASLLTVAVDWVDERRLFGPLADSSSIQSACCCCCCWLVTSVRHGCSRQLPSLLGPVLAGDVAESSSPAAVPASPGLTSPVWLAVDVSSWFSASADRLSHTIRRLSHGLDGDEGAPADAGLPGELLRLMLMFSLDSVRRWVQRLRRSLDAERWDVKRPRIDGRIRGPVRFVRGDPPGDEVLLTAAAATAAELALTLLASLVPWRRSVALSLEWPLELVLSCCCCCCGWWWWWWWWHCRSSLSCRISACRHIHTVYPIY